MEPQHATPFWIEILYDGERLAITPLAVVCLAREGLTPIGYEVLALAAHKLRLDVGGLITLALALESEAGR